MKRNRIGLIVLTAMLCVSTSVFANWRETVDIGNIRVKTITANPGFGNTSITVASPITLSSTITISGDLTLGSDLILETGGIVRNDAVDDFEFLGTNQTATLAELIIGTTANQSTIANNDLFNIKAVAPDSASNDTSYATIALQITDKTTTSEDGQIVLKAMKAGSDTTVATLGYTSAGAEVGTFTVPIDCDSLTVDAAGAGVDAQSGGALVIGGTTATSLDLSKSAAMTTVKGTLNVDQGVTLDSTLAVAGTTDLNAPTTCTNVSLDAGSTLTIGTATIVPTSATELTISETTVTVSGTTLAAPAVTCTTLSASGAVDMNAPSTATNITMDTGSTLAAKTLTVATACTVTPSAVLNGGFDSGAPSTATNITLDAGAKLIGTTTLTLGSGTEGVAIDGATWDITSAGAVSGFDSVGCASLTASGTITANGTIAGDNDTVVTGLSNTTWVAGSTLTVGTATIVPTSATELTISETTVTVSGTTLAAPALTATSFLLNGEAGVYAADATALMVQTTNVTMHAGTVWTQTWATAFGAAPTTTIITPTELHASVPFYSSNTTNSVLITVEASKDFTLTQIGAKP